MACFHVNATSFFLNPLAEILSAKDRVGCDDLSLLLDDTAVVFPRKFTSRAMPMNSRFTLK
jgi:hypothetical protein